MIAHFARPYRFAEATGAVPDTGYEQLVFTAYQRVQIALRDLGTRCYFERARSGVSVFRERGKGCVENTAADR